MGQCIMIYDSVFLDNVAVLGMYKSNGRVSRYMKEKTDKTLTPNLKALLETSGKKQLIKRSDAAITADVTRDYCIKLIKKNGQWVKKLLLKKFQLLMKAIHLITDTVLTMMKETKSKKCI